jgi:AraC-like DNA-binding protein
VLLQLRDTTNPLAHHDIKTLFGEQSALREIELVTRFRIQFVGLYYAEVGKEWSSKGQEESDYLNHVELVCSGHRQVIHAGKVLELEPGWAYFLPGCTPVERRCAEWCRLYFVKFRCEWLPGVDPLLDWPARAPVRLGRWSEEAFAQTWSPTRPPASKGLFQLYGQIYGWLAEALPSLGTIILEHLKTHSRFEKAFNLIEEQLGGDLHIERLAACMKLPRHAFSMAFKRSVGISPKAYLNRRLNQEAIKLLISSNVPIKEIAFKLKFADEYYFSRFFRKLNGTPPAIYRRRFRQA